jgi:outer membrane protein assembly factor BamB
MIQEYPQRRRLLRVLGGVILVALVLLCYVQVVPFVRARFTTLLLPTSNVAPPACAHETPDSPRTPLQEDLFVAVTSSVTSGTAGFIKRGVPIVDSNAALCVVRSSDGAIVGHYALDATTVDLAQAAGVLYVLHRHVKDAQVCAMRASDGKQLWCQTSSPTILPLVVSEGLLYLQGDTAITALRASDGAVLWTRPIQRGSDTQSGFVELAVVSGSVYILISTTQVCALQASDGATRWCTSSGSLTDAIRLVADTTGVYVLDRSSSSDTPTRIVALRSTDGASMWQRSFQRIATIARSSLLAQNGLVFLSTYHSPYNVPFQEVLTALQTSDGTTRWETTTGQSLVATAQGNVAYLADSTSLQAREASTGKLLWKQSIRRTERMMVSGSMLYLSDDVQELFAIKTSTGQVLWERIQCIDDSDIIASEPHTKNGSVVWCTWGTDRLKNGLAAPTALAAGT